MTQPIIKRSRVHVVAGRPTRAVPVHLVDDPQACPPGEKGVRLLQEAGRVTGIELTCSCGEVTAVELLYPEEPAA